MSENKARLTSSEIGALWSGYMNDSMASRVLGFMLKHLTDSDIKPVVQYAYDTSVAHLETLTAIFEKEQFAIPEGFSEEDVNMDAPWLFTDVFCLTYANHMARVGMLAYSGFASVCYREDMRAYFSQGLKEVNDLYNMSTEVALKKGINARHPYIEVPNETDYVSQKQYLSGLNPFHEKRALNAVEISNLYLNIMTNSIGYKLCIAFAQTSPLKEVKEFMLRSKEVSQKHIKIFTDILMEADLGAPQIPDVSISDSITKTFSDKLIMYHMSLLVSSGIGNYATAVAASQRSDLMVNYERLSLEVAKLAKTGADIMIKHRWLEQPPSVADRHRLAEMKETD